MRYTIDTTVVKFNNEWQHLPGPLARFTEHGEGIPDGAISMGYIRLEEH